MKYQIIHSSIEYKRPISKAVLAQKRGDADEYVVKEFDTYEDAQKALESDYKSGTVEIQGAHGLFYRENMYYINEAEDDE